MTEPTIAVTDAQGRQRRLGVTLYAATQTSLAVIPLCQMMEGITKPDGITLLVPVPDESIYLASMILAAHIRRAEDNGGLTTPPALAETVVTLMESADARSVAAGFGENVAARCLKEAQALVAQVTAHIHEIRTARLKERS